MRRLFMEALLNSQRIKSFVFFCFLFVYFFLKNLLLVEETCLDSDVMRLFVFNKHPLIFKERFVQLFPGSIGGGGARTVYRPCFTAFAGGGG